MAVAVVNIRALRNEADWLPLDLDEIIIVRRVLDDAEIPDQMVNSIVGWLIAKAAGHPDRTMANTRATYRKVLAELQSPLSPRNGDAIPRYLNSPIAA